jgi:hypothetical protein
MRRFIWATAYVTSGVAVGCFSAFAIIQSAGVAPVAADAPWQSRAAALAGPNAFYVRSHYLLEGRLPPAPSQLGEATAENDGDGRLLSGSCSYLITSTGPLPRWWSIGVIESDKSKAALQTTADSDTAVRETDGSVKIITATEPQPGNWLKTPDRRRFTLIYSALSNSAKPLVPPFAVKRKACS